MHSIQSHVCYDQVQPLHSHYTTFILSLKAQSSHFSLNSTLLSLCSSYSSCLSYSNQPHFLPPFSQALQEPPSLVFEEDIQTHTWLHLQAPREETFFILSTLQALSKFLVVVILTLFLCMFQALELLSFSIIGWF